MHVRFLLVPVFTLMLLDLETTRIEFESSRPAGDR